MSERKVTVRAGEDRYVDLIKNYWLDRGYLVDTYIADSPILTKEGNRSGHNYQAVRSNMINGLPRAEDKILDVSEKINYRVVGDDRFLTRSQKLRGASTWLPS